MLNTLPDFSVNRPVLRLDPSRPEGGEILIFFDRQAQVIRIDVHGNCSPDYADQHFLALKDANEAMRTELGIVRVLIDARNSLPQSPATAQRIVSGNLSAFQSGDRAAVVVETSLKKMQMKRVVDFTTHHLFVSENAALIWLKAYDC